MSIVTVHCVCFEKISDNTFFNFKVRFVGAHDREIVQDRRSSQVHIQADLAQLGERETEDLKVPGSIPGIGKLFMPQLSALTGQSKKADSEVVVTGYHFSDYTSIMLEVPCSQPS